MAKTKALSRAHVTGEIRFPSMWSYPQPHRQVSAGARSDFRRVQNEIARPRRRALDCAKKFASRYHNGCPIATSAGQRRAWRKRTIKRQRCDVRKSPRSPNRVQRRIVLSRQPLASGAAGEKATDNNEPVGPRNVGSGSRLAQSVGRCRNRDVSLSIRMVL